MASWPPAVLAGGRMRPSCGLLASGSRSRNEHEDRNDIHAAGLNVLPTDERVSFAKANSVQERDVTKDADAVAELQRLGYVTTPITVIDGAVIVGFDAAKLDAALKSS